MNTKGQSLFEYTAVIACVVAALLGVSIYAQRAIQGRMRSSSDQIGEQYEPGSLSGNMTTTVTRNITSDISTQPWTVNGQPGQATFRTETINQDDTVRTGTETLGTF
jgi:hypothetical protein